MHIYDRQIPNPCELSIRKILGVFQGGGGGGLLQELTRALLIVINQQQRGHLLGPKTPCICWEFGGKAPMDILQ
jgi:hypothetical protein